MTVSKVLNLATGEYLPSVVVGTDFILVGGSDPTPPSSDGEVTIEKLTYDLPELSLPPVISDFVIPSVTATVPPQADVIELAAVVIDNTVVTPLVEAINITASIAVVESLPTPDSSVAVLVIPVVDIVPSQTDFSFVRAEYNIFANSVDSSNTWANPNNVLGDNTSATTLTATATGLAGSTNETSSGSITIDFRDVNYGNLAIASSVILSIESQHQTNGIPINPPTTTVAFQYSVGGSFTTFHTQVINAGKSLQTVDLTSVINQDPALIDSLKVRAVGQVTSGTGLGVSSTVFFFRSFLTFDAERGYT